MLFTSILFFHYCREECKPVELQPLVVSPRAWIWNPWRPGESPVILPVTWVVPAQSQWKRQLRSLAGWMNKLRDRESLQERKKERKKEKKERANEDWRVMRETPLGCWTNWREPLTLLSPMMRATAFTVPFVASISPVRLCVLCCLNLRARCPWMGITWEMNIEDKREKLKTK